MYVLYLWNILLLRLDINNICSFVLGIPSKLKIIENSLSFTLQSNNTFLIRAKLDAEVSARTWIWKGINFGLLGCLKITSCSGEIVTYTANIDMELSTQVLWKNDKMSIFIKPVDTAINNVNVQVSLHFYTIDNCFSAYLQWRAGQMDHLPFRFCISVRIYLTIPKRYCMFLWTKVLQKCRYISNEGLTMSRNLLCTFAKREASKIMIVCSFATL